VAVLMSWCTLSTLTAVTPWTRASMVGRAVSIRWVRTCFKEVAALLAWKGLGQVLFGGGQDALEPDHEKVADQVGVD